MKYASCFTIQNTLGFIDFFKQPLPVFNIKGRSDVPSYCGAFSSVLIMLILSIYGLYKFVKMLDRENPNIANWVEYGAID